MTRTLAIAAELNNLPAIRSFVEESLGALPVPPVLIDDLMLAVDELACNIMHHGYRGQPGGIEISISHTPGVVQLCLRDQAPAFDPTLAPPADVTSPLEERPIGGLGIHIARQLVDAFTYRRTPHGSNELTLTRTYQPLPQPLQETSHANDH